MVGTSTATHGYSIGAWLTSPTKGELNMHHTAVASVAPQAGSGPNTTVQRNNYATAFRLSHGERLSAQIRDGQIEDERIPFFAFDWLGHQWLAGFTTGWFAGQRPVRWAETFRYVQDEWREFFPAHVFRQATFAVESSRALKILRVLSEGPVSEDRGFNLEPMSQPLIREARTVETGAAIFPDGLATISRADELVEFLPVVWHRARGVLLPA